MDIALPVDMFGSAISVLPETLATASLAISSRSPPCTTWSHHVLLACRALECMLTEIARVRCHGFSEKEVDKARKSLQVRAEQHAPGREGAQYIGRYWSKKIAQ